MEITHSATRLVTALAAACWASAASAQGVGRLEIHAIPSVTVSNQQFLTGDRYGKPVIIGGELRLPRGTTDRFPMVILIHGSGGNQDRSLSNDAVVFPATITVAKVANINGNPITTQAFSFTSSTAIGWTRKPPLAKLL